MDKNKILESKKCLECTEWTKYCSAECCKIIFLGIDEYSIFQSGKYLSIELNYKLGIDEINYYKFRDVEYLRGKLRFKKERIKILDGELVYLFDCKYLKDNLCEIQDKKPIICRKLTFETAKLENQPFKITKNCLFKYKCKEVN